MELIALIMLVLSVTDCKKRLTRSWPDDQQEVFAAIYLENGELLNRPRTYVEVTYLTGLTIQRVRLVGSTARQWRRNVPAALELRLWKLQGGDGGSCGS